MTLVVSGKPPEKLPEMSRVAMIDLPVTEPQDPPSSQLGSTHSILHQDSSKHLTEEAVEVPVKDHNVHAKKKSM